MDANEAVKVVREGRELKVTLYRKGDPEWTTHVLTELEADRFAGLLRCVYQHGRIVRRMEELEEMRAEQKAVTA